MTTTIVTKQNSPAYAIYVGATKVVECNTPETSYNELVKNIGVPTASVQVIELSSFPNTLPVIAGAIVQEMAMEAIAETGSIDEIINRVNAGMVAPSAQHLGRAVRSESRQVEPVEPVETAEPASNPYAPVGNVAIPKLGNLVYVSGMDGILRKITGGIGTVHMVYNEATRQEICQDDNEDAEDLPNMLIELEEIPGVYFSWNELKDKQDELQAKYGHKPACSVF